jgi:tripartite-type tricarboxylate transporter receptor subunit TctC
MPIRSLHISGCVAAAVLVAGSALGQDYPTKPVRIIVPGVGNSFDIAARVIGQTISPSLGEPVVVDNRPVGVIPGELVAKAPPDGYTLIYSGSSLWLSQVLQKSAPYDALKDFQPITLATRSPTLLVVHPSLPVKTAKDLIALAKAQPGVLNYATASTGSVNHLTAELFQSMAGIRMVRVTYRGSAPALNDLIAGQVHVMFSVTGSVAPFMKSGKLKVIAVTSAQPTPLAPGVPTVAATGLPGFEAVSYTGMFAPARTPKTIIERLNREVLRALSLPEVREKFLANGVEPVGGGADQLDAAMRTEMQRVAGLIKEGRVSQE